MRVVDADVVVPTSLFPKEEFAARTLRPKMHKVWDDYLVAIDNPKAHIHWPEVATLPKGEPIDPDHLMEKLNLKGTGPVEGYLGGTVEALRRLKRFLKERLSVYDTERNEPTPYKTTELSAHLHFGHIGPSTIAMAVKESGAKPNSVAVLLEELIVRRELAINFVSRNPEYDRLQGCADWGLEDPGQARQRPPAGRLHRQAARSRRDGRPALERLAEGDGPHRPDAQLPEDVLGQEDPRMVARRRRPPSPSPSALNDRYEM